jgi:hypothetical protein
MHNLFQKHNKIAMKKTLLTLILILTIISCSEEKIDISHSEQNIEIGSRAIVSDGDKSITNPTLLTNWENTQEIILNSSSPTNPNKVTPPWKLGTSSTISMEIAQDIKKEDGWIMLMHTFKDYGLDKGNNYMIFYNQFTGFLKIFYYVESAFPNNHFLWEFKSNNPTSLFSLNEYIIEPDNSTNKATSVILGNVNDNTTTAIGEGWNGFQIEVPYTVDNINHYFTIQGYNQNIINYNFTGEASYTTEGTIIKTVKKGNSLIGGVANAVGELSGGSAKKGIDNLVKNDKIKLGNTIKNAILGIGKSGYVGAISAGLKFIGGLFGSKTTTETEKVNLKTTGTMKFDGTSTAPGNSPVFSITGINLYNLYKEGVGIWNVKDDPQIVIERYSILSPGYSYDTYDTYKVNARAPYAIKTVSANISINPAIEKYIIHKEISCTILTCDSLYGKPYGQGSKYRPKTDLVYKDDNISLYEGTNGKYIDLGKVTYRKDHKPLFDWGIMKEDKDIVNITVELTFNFQGKEITTISSRMYKPKSIMGGDYYLEHGNPWICKPI